LKRVLLVSAYFLPSNFAGVQRVRLLASHIREFGWQPVVVTVGPQYYEEAGDEESLALLPDDLEVERVGAWPARICRPLGFGDISLRGQFAMRCKVRELIQEGNVDLIFATVLPGYTSLIGAWAKRKFGIPFVLDYQDPWVNSLEADAPRWSKAGVSHWLALKLEPGAVARADALSAVSNDTLNTLRERRLVRTGMPIEIIPIGAGVEDHAVAARVGCSRILKEFGGSDIAYLGTLTARMLPALRGLLLAAKRLVIEGVKLRVHLIGTSAQPVGEDTIGVRGVIQETGATDFVRLEPRRIPYLDALRTMQDADVLLLLGSTDAHYTASKIFPCWLAKRPIMGFFHASSTINTLAQELGGVSLIAYDNSNGPETRVREMSEKLTSVLTSGMEALPPRVDSAFEPYSARGVARSYAALFDRVSENKDQAKWGHRA
jgi:hypothetical protein